MKLPYIIAEIGVNFIDTAKEKNISEVDAAKIYIDEAAKSGVNAVKFQSYKANTIVSKNSPAYWDLTKEPTKTQYELFLKNDMLNAQDYANLADYCKQKGVDFMSTPFDDDAVEFLDPLVKAHKISSSDLTNLPFIRRIAKKKKPVYLSVGASYLYEIDRAVQILKEENCPEICLMHCVLSYPTHYKDANLNQIKTLKRIYPNFKIGYSDHTVPDENMAILTGAYLMGAQIIEKHFTIDKTLQGNDHYHAGDGIDFKKAIDNFKLLDSAIGSEERRIIECENIPRREARRSIVIINDIKKGDIIKSDDIMTKRPGTGVSPEFVDVIVGRSAKEDITADTVLQWEMV